MPLFPTDFKPVTMAMWGAVTAGFVFVLYRFYASPDHFVLILDHANLIFHEAGHPIFGILGPTLGLYGGTLGQLTMPAIVTVAFWRQRETLGVAVGGGWFFENFLNIGRYMADARTQLLPLVGGGEHDWTNIFTRWGVLAQDTHIATAMAVLGWLGILGTWGWLGVQWRLNSESK